MWAMRIYDQDLAVDPKHPASDELSEALGLDKFFKPETSSGVRQGWLSALLNPGQSLANPYPTILPPKK